VSAPATTEPPRPGAGRHYLDHASTSPLRPEARTALEQALALPAADPGRAHHEGRTVRAWLEGAREQVAELFGVRPRQVVLTSSGTEAVNTAVWGALGAPAAGGPVTGPRLVACAAVEHSAVRTGSERLAHVVDLPVDGTGRLSAEGVADALDRCRAETGRLPDLVHCQWANHEVGTVQPVAEVVALCHARGVPVHVDAAAAAGHVHVDAGTLGAELVSVSSHKLGGPSGAGALLVGRGLRYEPLLVGGAQERARRAGFEDLPAAAGFGAAAAALARPGRLDAEAARAEALAARLAAGLCAVEGVTRYGHPTERLPHLVAVGIDGVEGEPVLLGLDQRGIAAHSGSSCSSESFEPSPVLEAMGVDGERSLRLSVGWSSTDTDVDACLAAFPEVVAGLRRLRR
jgi:cysteine desulfurase